MHSQKTQALYYYWLGLKQTRKAPNRRDIEPRQLKTMLPNLFILEQLDQKHCVFRLAGTSICERYGREFRAHNFLSLWRGDDRLHMTDFLHSLLREVSPGLITYRGETIDRLVVDSEILLLPLANESGVINKFMGCATPLVKDDFLRHRKIVNQWILVSQLVSSQGILPSANQGAPRPMRVEKPQLRLVSSRSVEDQQAILNRS